MNLRLGGNTMFRSLLNPKPLILSEIILSEKVA